MRDKALTESLVVDANPLISALLGGNSKRIVFSERFLFFCPQATLFEVEKYLPHLAVKLRRTDLDLFRAFQLLPVHACQPRIYDSCVAQAERLIAHRDRKDVPVFALSLHLDFPVWTEDRDFDGVEGVQVRRTAELLVQITNDSSVRRMPTSSLLRTDVVQTPLLTSE